MIEAHLLGHGYARLADGYDRGRALFPDPVIGFIRQTQPKEWAKLEALHGAHTAAQVNSAEKFLLLFKRLLETIFIERMDQNELLFARYMNDRDFQKVIAESLGAEVYQRLVNTSTE